MSRDRQARSLIWNVRRAIWLNRRSLGFRFSRLRFLNSRPSWFRVAALELGFELPERYVETGTYLLDSFTEALKEPRFHSLHTIDLEPRFVSFASRLWTRYRNCGLAGGRSFRGHVGDSADQLEPFVSDSIPTLFFLDAHFSGKGTAFGREECPLLRELMVLRDRNVKGDVIIIDDFRLLGFAGPLGSPKSIKWPVFEANWSDITFERIKELCGVDKTYVKWPDHCFSLYLQDGCDFRQLFSGDLRPMEDRLIIF